MIKLERLFSKEHFLEGTSDEEICDHDQIESSKTQIPYNKAFLSLALVEPQRTISFSLDELDRCVMNKADLVNSVDQFKNRYDENDSRKQVAFADSPNMYSLSTISEHSDSPISPLVYNPRKGSLEVALDTLSSSCPEDTSLSYFDHDIQMVENKKSVSVTDTVETIDTNDSTEYMVSTSKEDAAVDQDFSSDDEPNQKFSKISFLQLKKVPASDELHLFEKRRDSDDLSRISDEPASDNVFKLKFDESAENKENYHHREQNSYPKSILKKSSYEMSGPMSEPIRRRHTAVPSHFFGNGVKSVSHVCDSSTQRIFPIKQKKHSAPARMPLTKLKSCLKINRKFLNSLQQTDNHSEELIELLVKQAELLNEDIKYTLMLNALKYGGIAVVAILFTCASLRYCIKYKRCD